MPSVWFSVLTRSGRRPPFVYAAMALAGAAALSPPPASANWLSKLARETAEIGAKSADLGLGALADAGAVVKALPATEKGAALAVHATPEGHWRFANGEGEVFTAGTPEELGRAAATLAPAAPAGKLALYLSESTAFEESALLGQLPANAELYLVSESRSYPLARRATESGEQLFAGMRPNVAVRLTDAAAFREAVWRLARPLDAARVRVLALEPGGPKSLSSSPRFDPATQAAMVDVIDPGRLSASLGAARGQTVLLTGRIEGGRLHVRPSSGPEQSLATADLVRAAKAADVDLVILRSPAPRQPGGRNWFWQKVEVAGLGDALARSTFADFLDALGAGQGRFEIAVTRDGADRIVMTASPSGQAGTPGAGVLGEWFGDLVSGVTGNVAATAVEAHLKSAARQLELDARIIPFIPSSWQFVYLGAMAAGAMGLGAARGWWRRLWPPEERQAYDNALGFVLARLFRLLAFGLVFLPAAGLPALIVAAAAQIWTGVTFPVRAWRWLAGRPAPRADA